MDVTLLVIGGCPNTAQAEEHLRSALATTGRPASFVVRTLTTDAEAASVGFAGSPTILIDGHDPFPGEPVAGLSCRLFTTPDGRRGTPSVDQLVEVLKR